MFKIYPAGNNHRGISSFMQKKKKDAASEPTGDPIAIVCQESCWPLSPAFHKAPVT